MLMEENNQKILISVEPLTGGKTITLEVSAASTVRDLKEQIELREGIPTYGQSLRYSGKDLENHVALKEYGIGEGTTVSIWVVGETKVIVPLPKGRKYGHSPLFGTTVLDFKQEMEKQTGIPAKSVRLFYSNYELRDARSIFLNIPSKAEVELRLQLAD